VVAKAFGQRAWNRSRSARIQRAAYPARTAQAAWILRPPKRSIHSLAELGVAECTASAVSGSSSDQAEDVCALAGSLCQPSQEIGAAEMKDDSACD